MKNITKRGRPSVFCDEYITQAYRYAMLGATDEQMAHFFGVNSNTLDKWKQKYPAFSHALKHGKAMADQAVMENLYKLANGYELTETRELVVNGLKQTETFTKKYPPSLGAIQFWLKNRMKQEWNERYRAEPAIEPVDDDHTFTGTVPRINIMNPSSYPDGFFDDAPVTAVAETEGIAAEPETTIQLPEITIQPPETTIQPPEKTPPLKREVSAIDENGKLRRLWPYQ